MTIAILATGDEIVHGDTLNTNGHEIAHALCSEGLPLGMHLTCSDKENDIIESLQFLTQHHNILIIIGGLGPTTDDLTRFALAKFTGATLIQYQEALDHIQNRILRSNRTLNAGNLQQALFPPDVTILPNPYGTAVGCSYLWQDKHFILLPGPPRECMPMFNQYVLPLLQHTLHSNKQILKWRIFGLAESEIAHILEDALANVDCQTGYRLETPYIEFKVRCKSELVQTVRNIIDPILAPHIISTPEQKASEKLVELIKTQQQPITIIDQVTGGLLETLLVKPSTYHLLQFHESNKTQLVFHIYGLNEYWNQEPPNGSTQLTIHYRNQEQEGGETHELPYRSALVVNIAAEWLCFRLFHLINQLH